MPAGLAVDSNSDLHLIFRQFKGRLTDMRYRTGSKRHPHAATLSIHLVAECRDLLQRSAAFGSGSTNLFRQHGCTDPSPAGGVKTVFYRNVVVDHHGFDLDALATSQVRRHLKIHDVPRVILYDVKDSFSAVHCLGRLVHLVRSRAGKNRSRTGSIQHPATHKAAVHRFVPAAAAGNNGDFVLNRSVFPNNIVWVQVNFNQVTVSGSKTAHGFKNNVLGGINQFFHVFGGTLLRVNRRGEFLTFRTENLASNSDSWPGNSKGVGVNRLNQPAGTLTSFSKVSIY